MKIGIYNTTPQRSWYIDVVFSIFKNNGYDIHLTDNPEDCFEDDITIGFVNVLHDKDYVKIYKKSKCFVFVQLEQLNSNEKNLETFLSFEKNCDMILESSPEMFGYTTTKTNKPVILMPFGYHEDFDFTDSGRTTSVPWDVFNLDLGFLTDNRIDFYQELEKTNIVFNRQTRFDFKTMAYFVKNSKICLNVHGWGEGSFLPDMKIICRYMSNKGFVLSQRSNNKNFVENEHIAYFDTPEEMIEKIGYYIEHQDEAREIADNAYNYIGKHLSLTDSVVSAIKEIEYINSF